MSEDHVQHATQQNADDFLAKPSDLDLSDCLLSKSESSESRIDSKNSLRKSLKTIHALRLTLSRDDLSSFSENDEDSSEEELPVKSQISILPSQSNDDIESIEELPEEASFRIILSISELPISPRRSFALEHDSSNLPNVSEEMILPLLEDDIDMSLRVSEHPCSSRLSKISADSTSNYPNVSEQMILPLLKENKSNSNLNISELSEILIDDEGNLDVFTGIPIEKNFAFLSSSASFSLTNLAATSSSSPSDNILIDDAQENLFDEEKDVTTSQSLDSDKSSRDSLEALTSIPEGQTELFSDTPIIFQLSQAPGSDEHATCMTDESEHTIFSCDTGDFSDLLHLPYINEDTPRSGTKQLGFPTIGTHHSDANETYMTEESRCTLISMNDGMISISDESHATWKSTFEDCETESQSLVEVTEAEKADLEDSHPLDASSPPLLPYLNIPSPPELPSFEECSEEEIPGALSPTSRYSPGSRVLSEDDIIIFPQSPVASPFVVQQEASHASYERTEVLEFDDYSTESPEPTSKGSHGIKDTYKRNKTAAHATGVGVATIISAVAFWPLAPFVLIGGGSAVAYFHYKDKQNLKKASQTLHTRANSTDDMQMA